MRAFLSALLCCVCLASAASKPILESINPDSDRPTRNSLTKGESQRFILVIRLAPSSAPIMMSCVLSPFNLRIEGHSLVCAATVSSAPQFE